MIKTNIKMRVNSEQSKQVQEICFANGISWNNRIYEVQHLTRKYLFIKDIISWGTIEAVYNEKDLEEISAELFIRTKGTCVEETMEKNEVESYKDVKEYLIAKGLYERVLNLCEDDDEYESFSDLFTWSKTEEGHDFWDELNDEMLDLDIFYKIKSLVQDYRAKQCEEWLHIETKPEEVIETKPLEKPKQYLCYVQGKSLPKHIHKTLEQAKQEAQRLCRKELAKVSVLEVVAEYEAEVLVKEVL